MDTSKTIDIVNSNKEIIDSIINSFKLDYLMSLEAKINFTAMIYMNRELLLDNEDFYEEECHLSLVNWIYQYAHLLKTEYVVDEKIFHLIYNILIIFEILPIKVNDLFELKIFEKLNKIRKYIKNKNFNVYHQLYRLITYWTNFCTDNAITMKNKRNRTSNDEDLEIEKPKKKVCIENLPEKKIILSTNKLKSGILKKYSNIKNIKNIKWNDEEITKIKIFNFADSPDESCRLIQTEQEEEEKKEKEDQNEKIINEYLIYDITKELIEEEIKEEIKETLKLNLF